MENLQFNVGDTVAIERYKHIEFVDTVSEVTKDGDIILAKTELRFSGKCAWSNIIRGNFIHIRKISEEEHKDYLLMQKIKQKRNKIADKLKWGIADDDLISYWAKIDMIYDILFEEQNNE